MNNMDKSYHELHDLLVQAERDMEANEVEKKDVLSMRMKNLNFGVRKRKGKQKTHFKKGAKAKGKTIMNRNPKPKTTKHPNDKCNHCGELGHWKRNCPKYLKEKNDGCATPSGV
ncbi:hypothetical protein RND81_11G020100 [Saponaria officinalis]|uniref:CCHC-type domain-containing protein n=1 Tax=Saponaria officinalis TaxID=3572 RepID=A0AAW1HH39_SAPOF